MIITQGKEIRSLFSIRCRNCGQPYPQEGLPYKCRICGGQFDYESSIEFDGTIIANQSGLWKYRKAFDFPIEQTAISLGEGNTPLENISYKGINVSLKLEFLNPTGSYKDRGSSLLINQMVMRGITEAVEDSSGNAGASFAAYAARAGVKPTIYIPESASGPKRAQIEWYGAKTIEVPGARSNAARRVLEAVDKGAIYASHAHQPFGLPGIATISYELVDQMKEVPGTIIAPVGHGGLLLGVIRGFQALVSSGRIKKMPYFVGVQAKACDPLVELFHSQVNPFDQSSEIKSIAEGVKVINPSRSEVLIDALGGGKGEFIAIEETEIERDHKELARKGFFVEPTSALVWSALKRKYEQIPEPIVAILTGSGLKYS